jgi:hypothetical protein
MTEPTITPLSYTCISRPFGQIPLTVIGDVVNVAPLPGVVIVAPSVGGGCGLVASNPYAPGIGLGIGNWVIADAGRTCTNNVSRHTPIAMSVIQYAFKRILPTMFMLIVPYAKGLAFIYGVVIF